MRLLSVLDKVGWGVGGLNVLRLVSKRCLQVVESVATRLTGREYSYETLPVAVLKRCKRIEHITCDYPSSLEGCPDGLKSLFVWNGSSLESLEPLSACKQLETLEIHQAYTISDLSPLYSCMRLKNLLLTASYVTDLAPLSHLLLLEELDLYDEDEISFISIISPLSYCKKLKNLNIGCNVAIKDLSPLSQCPDLEELHIYGLPLIKDLSFFENGFTKLRDLLINSFQVDDLSPLIKLQSLEVLDCHRIPHTTSLLPLARCYKLKKLNCSMETNLEDLNRLREMRPEIEINPD